MTVGWLVPQMDILKDNLSVAVKPDLSVPS